MSDQAVASARMIGEIFVERGLVTPAQLDEALALQARDGGLIGEILVSSFGVSRVELATVLAEQWRAIDHAGRGAPSAPEAEADKPNVVALPSPDANQTRRPIGEIFVASGAITQDDLDRALETQRMTGERLGEILVAQGSIGRLDLASALAEQWSELQVIRPPQPKQVEPWQETAVREAMHVAPVPAAAPAELAELAHAVGELDSRVTELARRQLPDIDAVRAEASALAARLEAIDARLSEAVGPDALAELAESLRRLRGDLDETRSELAERSGLQDELSAIRSRLEELSRASVGRDDLARVEEKLAELSRERVDPDALERVEEALSRLEGTAVDSEAVARVESRVAEVAESAVDRGALARVEEALGGLAERVAAVASDDSAQRIAERLELLEQRSGEPQLDAVWSALEALQQRLDAPAVGSEELRGSLDELRARVSGLAETIDRAPDAERLAALEAVVSDRSTLDEISTRLDVLARGAARREDVDALREALDRDVEALRHALEANRTDDLDQRFAQFDAALTELQQRVEARDAAGEPERQDREVVDSSAAGHAALEALGRRIDETLGRVERTEDDVSSAAQLASELALRLEQAVPEARVAAVEERLSRVGHELGERIDHLHGALGAVSLDALRDEVQQSVQSMDERVTVLQVQLDAAGSDRRDVDRAAEELRGELDRTRRGLEELVERVEAESSTGFEERLAETASRAELGALAGDVHGRLEQIEAMLASDLAEGRLGALDTQVAEVAEVAAAVADVDRRLAEIAARVDGAISGDEPDQKVAEQVAAASSALTSRLEDTVSASNDRLTAVEHELAEVDDRATRSVEAVREAVESRLADAVSRAEVGALAGELGSRAGRAEAATEQLAQRLERDLAAVLARVNEASAHLVGREELQALAGELSHHRAALEQALAEVDARSSLAAESVATTLQERFAETVSRGELDELWGRVVAAESGLGEVGARLAEALADVVRRDEVDERVAAQVATSTAGLSAELEHRMAEVAGRFGGLESALTEIDARALSVAEAVQQGVEGRLADTASRTELAELRTGVEAGLDARFAHAEHDTTARLDGVTGELHGAIAALHLRIDELAAGLGHAGGRLVAVEQALPEPGLVDELRHRVEAVHRQVAEEIALGDQRTKATERALRKGLAGLGERLVASEQAYVEAGTALRRSIERLGAAVVEADARIAGEPLDPPTAGFVAFVPTADGYRLTAMDGPVPALDAVVEVDGVDGLHRAARITRSPLPLDRRACVYLERAD